MATELNRLKRLLEKSLRDALEVELRRIGIQELKVKTDYTDAWIRMRVPEGMLEMTGSLHGFLRDALASRSEWSLRKRHVLRGGDINPDLDERSTFRAIASSLKSSLEAMQRVNAFPPHHNPHILDALAVTRACLAAQAQLKWDDGEAGLRPLKASLKATFRTYREHLARYESDPGTRAMADHCTSKIQSIAPVLRKVKEGVAAAKHVERLSREALAGVETADTSLPTP